MDVIYTLIIIILSLVVFYEQTKREGFTNITEEEKNKIVRNNDATLYLMYKKSRLSSLEDNNKKKISEYQKYPKKYNICFVTYEDRDEEYVKMHNDNIKKYCDKWGYEYILEKKRNIDISPYWYKVFLVRDILNTEKYDYIFWMDSDVIINNFNIDLGEDILHKYDSDIFVASDNTRYDIVNSGLFIVKNSKTGKKFLDDWINLYDKICEKSIKEGGNGLRGVWAMSCYEQGNLNKLLIDKYDKHTTLLNNNIFHNNNICLNDVFVMHYYATDKNERAKCFNNSIK
jgi:hypothetical protein